MDTPRGRELAGILDLVKSGRVSTRGEIVELLGLRSTSVSEFVGELVARDLLRESVPRQRGRGRPKAFLNYNWQRFGAVFVQVASRSLVARAVDMAGRVVAECHAAPPPDAGNDEIAATLRRLAGEARSQFPAGIETAAIVCSLSGLLDAPRRRWCFTSRWPALRNLDVGEALAGLGHDVVLVRNLDAELAGRLAEAPENPAQSVLLLHWGYGIGAACFTEGAIVNRTRGRFCEIGHWGLDNGRGVPCTCGNADCLETVAALWSLGPRLQETFADIPDDEDAFAGVAGRLDLLSLPQMGEALRQVVRLTGNLSRLLFPDRIVLTGPFVQNQDVFNRFVAGMRDVPVLRTLDRPDVVRGESGARYEMAGALSEIFDAALAALLAGEPPRARASG